MDPPGRRHAQYQGSPRYGALRPGTYRGWLGVGRGWLCVEAFQPSSIGGSDQEHPGGYAAHACGRSRDQVGGTHGLSMKRHRILVVEDSPQNTQLIEKIL